MKKRSANRTGQATPPAPPWEHWTCIGGAGGFACLGCSRPILSHLLTQGVALQERRVVERTRDRGAPAAGSPRSARSSTPAPSPDSLPESECEWCPKDRLPSAARHSTSAWRANRRTDPRPAFRKPHRESPASRASRLRRAQCAPGRDTYRDRAARSIDSESRPAGTYRAAAAPDAWKYRQTPTTDCAPRAAHGPAEDRSECGPHRP